jgi:initiation factor 1A
MPRNTTGGKNFKKFKTGSEGFRAKASREAVDDMIDLFIKQERTPDRLTAEDIEALKYMVIGRVTRKFGNARVETFCHDGKMRQCKIRGLLRKKGQVFIDNDSLVVVSLREAEESSDDDELGGGTQTTGTSDIIGCFDDRQSAILRKTKIDPRLFMSDREEAITEDLFDRDEIIAGGKNTIEEVAMDDL